MNLFLFAQKIARKPKIRKSIENISYWLPFIFLTSIEFHWGRQPKGNMASILSSMNASNVVQVDLPVPVSCWHRIHTRSRLRRRTARAERACRTSTAQSRRCCRELSDSESTRLLVELSRSKHLSLPGVCRRIFRELNNEMKISVHF